MVEELKPCPFCGGEAQTMVSWGSTYARCSENCIGGQLKAPVAAWNTRAADPRGFNDDPNSLIFKYRMLEGSLIALQAEKIHREELLKDALGALAQWEMTAPDNWHMDNVRSVGRHILDRAEKLGVK